jgi:hypothetical protein
MARPPNHHNKLLCSAESYVIVMGMIFILETLAQVGARFKEMENT